MWLKDERSNDPHTFWTISDRLICAPEKVWVSSTGLESKTHCDAGAELSPGQSVRHMCSCKRNNEWKKGLRSVVERWIEAMILTISGLSQGSSHIWDLHRRSHGFEFNWRHLKIFRRTNETIAEIIQKVWGSLLQFITTNNRQILCPHQGRIQGKWWPFFDNRSGESAAL